MTPAEEMAQAVAWRVEGLGGKFVVPGGAWQYEAPLPLVGTPERIKLDEAQARMIAGLLACADRSKWGFA